MKEILNAVAIKLGFIVDPTVDPSYRFRKRKIHLTILIVVILHLFFAPYVWGSSCLIQASIGFPCPTCGSIRSVYSLLSGDLAGGLFWHPLIFLSLFILFLGLVFSIYEEVRKQACFKAGKVYRPKYVSKSFWYIFVPVLILYLVVFIVRLIKLYPVAPMNYNDRSLLGRILKFFKSLN